MFKTVLGVLEKLFLSIGMASLAILGIVVVALIAGLLFADKILKLIF